MAAPAIAVLLASGAGVGSAEPLAAVRTASSLTQPRAATIRIVLPPPVRMAAAAPRQATGTVRFLLPPPRVEAPRPALPAKVDAPAPTPSEPAAALVSVAAAPDRPAGLVQPEVLQIIRPTVPGIVRGDRPDVTGPADETAMTAVREAEDFAPSKAAIVSIPMDDGVAPPAPTGSRYQRTTAGLAFQVAAKVNGTAVGPVSLLIRDGAGITVRLADLLTIIEPAVEPALFERLSASQAARSYVSLNELRAAGIPVRFDDKDRLIIGKR